MIDSLGDPQNVNTVLPAFFLQYISHENLKAMEKRACHIIEITRREKSDAGQDTIF